MSEAGLWINPKILRWARRRLGLTIEQVAEESKKLSKRHFEPISERELQAWEVGDTEPELSHLETLSEIYVCPIGWFFLQSPPAEELPMNFRGLTKSHKDLEPLSQRTLHRFTELAKWTVKTLQNTEQKWQIAIHPAEVEPKIDLAEEIAIEYRQKFGWTEEERHKLDSPREAFRWWRQKIESLGVFCFEMPLNPQDVRGAALWLEGYPFTLVNHQDFEAVQGRMFTLLHEFAHLISAKDGIVCDFQERLSAKRAFHNHNPESFANRFAARILLTTEELRRRLTQLNAMKYQSEWTDHQLDELRKPFFASRDVVAIMLQELNLAPQDFYERKRQQWQSQKLWRRGGKRPSLNERKLQEFGYSLSKLLARAANQPSFSWSETASVLGMKVEKVEAFLEWTRELV